jgi:hypothetical protein
MSDKIKFHAQTSEPKGGFMVFEIASTPLVITKSEVKDQILINK